VIPLRDDNPSRTVPVVTYLIVTANIAVFAYQNLLPPSTQMRFVLTYGAIPARFGFDQFPTHVAFHAPWLTLLSSMFLHGGLLHLGGNMLYLWIFGDNIEDAMGHFRFPVFYILCGFAAAMFQVAAGPESRIPLVGASGAIAGVLGAYALLYPTARVRTLIIFLFFVRIVPLPALLILGLWFVIQILSAPAAGGSGIAVFAHIGGFLIGMLLTGLFVKGEGRRRA
jgi:rhomboid family protein